MPTVTRADVVIHYEAAGDPAAGAVVFVPGMGAHSGDLLSETLRLALEADYRVLVIDNRGAGRTVVSENALSNSDDMAEDLAALLDAEGIGRAHILGYSLGVAITLAFALRHAARVQSLALAAGFAHIPMPSRTGYILEAMRDLRASGAPRALVNRFNALYLLSEPLFEHEAAINTWVNSEPGPYQQSPAGFTLQTEAFRHFDARSQLGSIQQPALVMSSPDDLLVPPHFQEELARGLPNSQLKHYPGGHAFLALPLIFPNVIDDLRVFWAQRGEVSG